MRGTEIDELVAINFEQLGPVLPGHVVYIIDWVIKLTNSDGVDNAIGSLFCLNFEEVGRVRFLLILIKSAHHDLQLVV